MLHLLRMKCLQTCMHACKLKCPIVTVLSNMPLCMLYICFLLGFIAFWTCEIKLILSYLILSISSHGACHFIIRYNCYNCSITGVIQKVLPVLSTETLLHIWLSTEYYGFRPSRMAVDTGDTRGLMISK